MKQHPITVSTTLEKPRSQGRPLLVPPITTGQIRALLAHLDVTGLDKLQDTTPFNEAGLDSLDFFNVISEIQEATGLTIEDQDIDQVNTVAGVVAYLNARMG